MPFETKRAADAPDAIAPDGAEVRLLCATRRGSMALFSLPPGAVSRAVMHRTVEEVWYFVSGNGRMWRRLGAEESIAEVGAGVSVAVPLGAHFQFRNDGTETLTAVGATMPPWPGADEAVVVSGIWEGGV